MVTPANLRAVCLYVFRYCWNLVVAIDVLANALSGGSPFQTISSRMALDIERGNCVFCKKICALLDLIHKDHCAKALANWRRMTSA